MNIMKMLIYNKALSFKGTETSNLGKCDCNIEMQPLLSNNMDYASALYLEDLEYYVG